MGNGFICFTHIESVHEDYKCTYYGLWCIFTVPLHYIKSADIQKLGRGLQLAFEFASCYYYLQQFWHVSSHGHEGQVIKDWVEMENNDNLANEIFI